jgi:hypothetical protein
VALNLGRTPVDVAGISGSVALSTNRARDGEPVVRSLALAPAEGAIVTVSQASSESSVVRP